MMDYSLIIHAGGKSSRMGQKKGSLLINDKTFIEIIRDKFLDLGICDILLSGYEAPVSGTKFVPDLYKEKGPLAGIHACLKETANKNAFVITEDAPLIPVGFIENLYGAHEANNKPITIAECGGRLQPLIGIYDKSLYADCEEMLKKDERRIIKLSEKYGYNKVVFEGDELLIRGCNTPEELEILIKRV